MYNYESEDIQQLIDDIDIVECISRYMDLKKKGNERVGFCPFHPDELTPSFTITPNKKKWYCFGCHEGGTVINFVQKFENISYVDALEKLAYWSNFKPSMLKRSQTLKYLKEISSIKSLPPIQREVLDKSVLSKFQKVKIKEWADEGISQTIMDRYGIMYDKGGNRIVYPVYDIDGNLINVKGRTLCADYKILGISKYMNYFKIGTIDYLQGLHMKKKIIQQANEIVLFEGIKSVMKLDTWGKYNSVSAETSTLNAYQIRLLISLNCNVVIAFDNDVDLKKIASKLNVISRFTNLYVIQDEKGLLGKKEDKVSPADKGREIWEELYNGKTRWRKTSGY